MSTEMFRPPINRAMRTLDRTFFQKDIQISAARIADLKNIWRIRNEFTKCQDIMMLKHVDPVRPDPLFNVNKKCILLRPQTKHDDISTWSMAVRRNVESGDISVIPYMLRLDYDHWDAYDILNAILPEDLLDDIPTGFNPVGHIAHLNLRERYLPYKNLIGEVMIDKNPAIRTAINKTETLGAENEFRVLEYEILAGDPDLQVDLTEESCRFHFDYSKVFWNSKLSSEHKRIADKFEPGDAICDVMAGIGPFVVPAGKKGVFAWANDLNPDCFKGLQESIKLNKVAQYVEPFNEDGHSFISSSAARLLRSNYVARIPKKTSRTQAKQKITKPADRVIEIAQPRTFSHYIMNLPSTAMDFLPNFIGLYAGHEDLFEPQTTTRLPMIHCYCFGPRHDADGQDLDPDVAVQQVCESVSTKLQYNIDIGSPDLEIHAVRDVAPNKRQLCAASDCQLRLLFDDATYSLDNGRKLAMFWKKDPHVTALVRH